MPTDSELEQYIRVARDAAFTGSEFLKKHRQYSHVLEKKTSAVDVVTWADGAVQEIVIAHIRKHFPHHSVLAEENSREKESTEEYCWAIDPIDGTSAFSVGLPTYAISIALLYKKQPIVGALYLSLINDIVWAVKGKGAYRGKKKLSVSPTSALIDSAVAFDPSYENRQAFIKNLAAPLADRVRILPMIYSQATALSLIALGILSGYIQCGSPHVWDAAAGKLLVEESGGIVTSFTGQPLDLFAINGYVAGTKTIHKALLTYLRSIKANFSS